MRRYIFFFLLLGTVFSFFDSHAEDKSFPELSGSVLFEVENDKILDSDASEVNALYATVEPYLVLSFTDNVALESSLIYEPVLYEAGENTFFENEGLYAEELKLTYSEKRFDLFAGKFNPDFGVAWDLAPGIYGTDFAEEYELTERIGFGGAYKFYEGLIGDYRLSANAFFLDTTFLSNSLATQRGRADKKDGGVSNTENLSSFSLTLDGQKFIGIDGLGAHAGFYSQHEGVSDSELSREKGYALGFDYAVSLSEDVEILTLVEWAGIRDAGGGADDVDYLTTSLGLFFYKNWNIAGSWTGRRTDVSEGGDMNDYLYQLSAGYEFDNGFSIDTGYRISREEDVNTKALGMLFAYTYDF